MAGHRGIMTVQELADFLRCNKSTIYRLIKTGQIPAFKVGSDWRITSDKVEQWLEQQHIKPAG